MNTKHFPARDVPLYAEAVPEDALVVGRTYFSVHYYDEAMSDPEMEALVYLGRDLFQDTPGFYFQDAGSYRAGVRYATGAPDDYALLCQAPGSVHVMEFERALDRLLYCSVIRSEVQPQR